MFPSAEILRRLLAFRAERDWAKFHNFRTLSTSIVLEAAELAEITQWTSDANIAKVVEERRADIAHEVADIAILLGYLVHDLGIDLERAIAEKIEVNAKRYPVEKAKGSAKKYDQFD